jgi:hypothetical protein
VRTLANPNANKRRLADIAMMQRLDAALRVLGVEGEIRAFEGIERGRGGALCIGDGGGFPGDTVLCSNDRLTIGLLSACYDKGLRAARGLARRASVFPVFRPVADHGRA